MIIFLDFDGVLHPETAFDGQDFSRRRYFWEILAACPQVDVVFSTSWRDTHPFHELIRFVTEGGGEELACRFLGTTPQAAQEVGSYIAGRVYKRHREILLWLAGNGQPTRPWIALDDCAGDFPPSCQNLHVADGKTGLTSADVTAVIAKTACLG